MEERRDVNRRMQVVRAVVDLIVNNPDGVATVDGVKAALAIPQEAARRILDTLVNAGVLLEFRPGVWARLDP